MNVDVEICSNEDSVNFMILGQDMIINQWCWDEKCVLSLLHFSMFLVLGWLGWAGLGWAGLAGLGWATEK